MKLIELAWLESRGGSSSSIALTRASKESAAAQSRNSIGFGEEWRCGVGTAVCILIGMWL
jgi:hypothetical protein